MTGDDVIARARIYMNDLTATFRWSSNTQMLPFINDGQRQIAQLVVGSHTSNGNITLVAGTVQDMPVCALKLYRAIRNMGADGATPGDVITNVSLDEFQVLAPGLHADDADAVCQYVAYDPRDPKHFYVYPAQPAASQGVIEISMASYPGDASSTAADLELDGEYLAPLAMYLTAQLMMSETEENSAAKATAMMNRFYAELKGIGAMKLPTG